MAIAYYAEEVKLPAIKKKAVGDWIRKVASLMAKEQAISVTSSVRTRRFWRLTNSIFNTIIIQI